MKGEYYGYQQDREVIDGSNQGSSNFTATPAHHVCADSISARRNYVLHSGRPECSTDVLPRPCRGRQNRLCRLPETAVNKRRRNWLHHCSQLL